MYYWGFKYGFGGSWCREGEGVREVVGEEIVKYGG